MSLTPRVSRLSGRVRQLVLGVTVLSAVVAGHGMFARVTVFVNGTPLCVSAGSTVARLAAQAGITRGDVVSVRDRRILRSGGGQAPLIVAGGAPVDPDARVAAGDRFVMQRGQDIVEPTTVRDDAIPQPTRTVGHGAMVSLVTPGRCGVERVTVGVLSGEVVRREVIVRPEPVVLRRSSLPVRTRVVALTFDDGPWPGQTDEVLRILEDRGVTATFFMIGRQVRAHPEIVRRVARAGHAIENHSYSHADLTRRPAHIVRREIAATNRAVEGVCGRRPRYARPPMGRVNARIHDEVVRCGLRPVLWTVDPQDWRDDREARDIERMVLRAVRPGAVILLHDGGGSNPAMVKALPRIIDGLRERGYEFVSLEEIERSRRGG